MSFQFQHHQMAYSIMEQDPDALLDIVLNMDSNSSDGLLVGASLQDTRTVDSEHIPVYTELTNSVFDDIEPAPHLTDLNGLIDIDSLPQVPFSPDAASLPHSGSGACPSLEWPSGTYAGSPTVHHRPANEGQGVTPRILPAPQSFQTSDFNANTHAALPNIQFINVQNPDPSRRHQHPQPAGSSPPAKPKTRRRVTTASQRKAANVRERRRMFNLNEAFDVLRKSVPTFAYEKRLSRIETLRLAMLYITFMGDVLSGKRSGDGNLQKLLESGKFAGLTNSNPGPRQGSTVLNSAASRMNRKPDGTTGAVEES